MNEKNDESDPFEVSTSFPEPPSFDSIGLPAAGPGPVFPPNTEAESSVPSDEPAPAPGGEPATVEPPPKSDPSLSLLSTSAGGIAAYLLRARRGIPENTPVIRDALE